MSAYNLMCIALFVLAIGFWIAGYLTGRETERMERRDTKPHHRTNRDALPGFPPAEDDE